MTQQTINALFNVKEYFDAPAFEKALLKAFGAIGPELLIQPILTPDDLQTLFIALEKAPHIKTLKFTQGALNDINSSFIAKALGSNTTLTTVDLSYTTLSFEAYYALASLLLDHKTLKNMNLRTDTFEDINVIGLALTPFMPTGVNFYLRGSSVYNLKLSELPSYVREPRLVNCELASKLSEIEKAYIGTCPSDRLNTVQSLLRTHIASFHTRRTHIKPLPILPSIPPVRPFDMPQDTRLMDACLAKAKKHTQMYSQAIECSLM